MSDVLVGCRGAFEVVGIEQALRRLALDDESELPGEIFRILDAGIGAARAERRHLMRGISCEDHAPMHEAFQAAALERIDGHPFEREIVMPQHLPKAGDHALRRLLGFRIRIGSKLQIDAPDIVRLFVQQGRASLMERRIEPEPSLGWKVALHLHIGDQEAIFEDLALKGETEHAA